MPLGHDRLWMHYSKGLGFFLLLQAASTLPCAAELSPAPDLQVVVVFGWGLVAGYVCMGLSARSVPGFLVSLAPIWTCVGVIDTVATAQLTKVQIP